jgi:FKBP-type peptidyl-prolyl cis-trans isomerase FkpA
VHQVRVFLLKFNIALLVLTAGAAAGCNDSATAPSDFAPFSQTDLRVGNGANAVSGNVLVVNYTGWLYDGSQADQKGAQFDSSAGFGPLTFILGRGDVIAGWDQGLVGMKVGGLRRLIIPPSLAYGGARRGPIPPNATLLFEVELLEVQ